MNCMPEEVTEDEEEAEEQSPVFDDAEYLEQKYHDEDLTQAEIGDEHDVTASTISHYMDKHGVDTRANQVDDERLEDEEWLTEQYSEEGEDRPDEIGMGEKPLNDRLNRYHNGSSSIIHILKMVPHLRDTLRAFIHPIFNVIYPMVIEFPHVLVDGVHLVVHLWDVAFVLRVVIQPKEPLIELVTPTAIQVDRRPRCED